MSPRSGAATREKLLDAAQGIVLSSGFAATSIDQIIETAGITKGTFFYHFKTKNDLARALIDRFARQDRELLDDTLARAEKLSADPVQRVLIFVGLFIEMAEQMEDANPGCLFASYCYEGTQFDAETLAVIDQAVRGWRSAFGEKLRDAVEARPPRRPVDIDSLADMLTVVFEGAYVVSRALRSPKSFAEQLRHFRSYLELLFEVPGATPAVSGGS